MKDVRFLSQIDEGRCTGCRQCETVCLTAAIRVERKRAQVDEHRCVACNKCRDVCREEAVVMVLRAEPVLLTTSVEDVDPAALDDLCTRAHLFSGRPICPCNGTPAGEVAAAILKGARSLEEIILMTGVAAGCGIYCMAAILRLVHASGIDMRPPKGQRWYDITSSLWNISDDVVRSNPGYYLEEDKATLF